MTYIVLFGGFSNAFFDFMLNSENILISLSVTVMYMIVQDLLVAYITITGTSLNDQI